MIRKEYHRFMQTLGGDGVPENVCKLANIIFNNLDDIIPLGTAAGRRVQKVVVLAQREFSTVSGECAVEIDDDQVNGSDISRLKSLNVGPFRGFAKAEPFDLDSQLVLIYGPNGSGKSSFCEALEYGLLGTVEEAENKRFREAREYLKNAHVGQFTSPVIEACFADSEPAIITADEAQFRFCFVEKNRIDNFSRIAAHVPSRQTQLISTLFGLDSFNEFVRNFSTEIGDRYIDLSGKKAGILDEKRKSLDIQKHTVTANTQALAELVTEEQTLAEKYQEDISFSDFIVALGTEEKPGEIQKIERDLQRPSPALSNVKHAGLLEQRSSLEKAITDLQEKEAELVKYSEGLSYKKLYQAVIALTDASKDNCPACKTPLSQTTEDPFKAAENGLSMLEHLSTLEQQRDQLRSGQFSALKRVHGYLSKACRHIGTEEQPNPLNEYLIGDESTLKTDWWNTLLDIDADERSAWPQLEEQVRQLESEDVTASLTQAQRQQKVESLRTLRELYTQAIQLQTKRQTLENDRNTAQKAISSFNEENKDLIAAVEGEKDVVAQNKAISTAYALLVMRLNRYKDSLPKDLVADLGERVVQLYNSFNRGDAPNDLLASLKLPTSSGERIEISFTNAPGTYFDALHILSEGHIRCVGLAILLAKNLKEGCPILIFDDPVNAIDDDHREAIRRTLFEDNYFEGKQIILTCHGEEFFKDIQNLLGAEKTRAAKRLTFLPRLAEKHIKIDSQSAPRNYVLAAQENMRRLEIRDALGQGRRALESLTNITWRYVSRHGDGNLSIKMRAHNAPIELRNLTEQLKKQLSRDDFVHEGKEHILEAITTLLGVNGLSREWRYLNKGTHDEADRAEFDRVTVKAIIDSLADLDLALN